MAYQLQRLFVV